MNAVLNSLSMMATGAFSTILVLFMLRSDWHMRKTLESVLKSRRQPVTPDAIEDAKPGAKAALIVCLVIGGIITVFGAIALVANVAKLLMGS